jgi:uracil phosphoribosyltransferase
LASKQGLSKISEAHPTVSVTVGVVDDVLTELGVVLPGMGDCGNRLYATEPIVHEDDESLLLPSKRKRSMDDDNVAM